MNLCGGWDKEEILNKLTGRGAAKSSKDAGKANPLGQAKARKVESSESESDSGSDYETEKTKVGKRVQITAVKRRSSSESEGSVVLEDSPSSNASTTFTAESLPSRLESSLAGVRREPQEEASVILGAKNVSGAEDEAASSEEESGSGQDDDRSFFDTEAESVEALGGKPSSPALSNEADFVESGKEAEEESSTDDAAETFGRKAEDASELEDVESEQFEEEDDADIETEKESAVLPAKGHEVLGASKASNVFVAQSACTMGDAVVSGPGFLVEHNQTSEASVLGNKPGSSPIKGPTQMTYSLGTKSPVADVTTSLKSMGIAVPEQKPAAAQTNPYLPIYERFLLGSGVDINSAEFDIKCKIVRHIERPQKLEKHFTRLAEQVNSQSLGAKIDPAKVGAEITAEVLSRKTAVGAALNDFLTAGNQCRRAAKYKESQEVIAQYDKGTRKAYMAFMNACNQLE